MLMIFHQYQVCQILSNKDIFHIICFFLESNQNENIFVEENQVGNSLFFSFKKKINNFLIYQINEITPIESTDINNLESIPPKPDPHYIEDSNSMQTQENKSTLQEPIIPVTSK